MLTKLYKKSKQERRIAEQFSEIRNEKEKIRENRIYRNDQYEQKRRQDYEESIALNIKISENLRTMYKKNVEQKTIQYNALKNKIIERDKEIIHEYLADFVFQLIEYSTKYSSYRESNGTVPDVVIDEVRVYL